MQKVIEIIKRVFAEGMTFLSNAVANLRSGPGQTYAITASTTISQALTSVARNDTNDWYQLEDGTWITAFLVDNIPTDLSVNTTKP